MLDDLVLAGKGPHEKLARMSIHEQIRAKRLAKGWSMETLAAEVSKAEGMEKPLSWQTVQQWEAGKSAPKRSRLETVATLLETTLGALMEESSSNVAAAPALATSRYIPVVGHVKAGPDGFLEEMDYPTGHGEGSVEYWARDPSAYALRVKGDSMHPRYRAGEFIVVTPSIEAQPGRDVVVKLKDGRKLLKQLNWIRGGEVQLLSINDGYAPNTLDMAEIDSIHRVAGSVPPDAFQND